jgi:hypothetical protein
LSGNRKIVPNLSRKLIPTGESSENRKIVPYSNPNWNSNGRIKRESKNSSIFKPQLEIQLENCMGIEK